MSTTAAGETSRKSISPAPFGTLLAAQMAVAWYRDGRWSEAAREATGPLPLHPAMHGLHYGSACFEGFKAYRHANGGIYVFRVDRHIARMQQSAATLVMPVPDAALLRAMVLDVIRANRDEVPDAPGALYLRPILFGTMPNIGAAASPT
ncbi:MAG: aminotransferase class IV, partial [Steroidobacteraceae bacterium]|nr:aminotransferase class IV [Steroidobacteraceae bacterium]